MIERRLTDRDISHMHAERRKHQIAKLQRDHDLELLLNAGVPLREAINLADQLVVA